MKEARVSWNRPMKSWVIRYWSQKDQEWNDDSYYPVKDVDPNTEYGWVSETMIARLMQLADLGYEVVFVK